MRPSLHAMLALALLLGSYVVAAGVLLAPFVGAVLVARTGPYGWLVGGILVALAGIGVWRVVLLVRRRAVRPAPGIALTRPSQGRLWAEVDEVAHELGIRTPDELRIVPDVSVTLSHDAWRRWPRSRRLCLGMPLLTSLTALQLRAVIAQELGLYSGRTGLLGTVTYRGGEALRAVAADVGADSVAGRIVRRYHRLYTSIAHSVIRRHELEADRNSARLAGRAAAAAALREVAATDRAWDYFLDRYADLGAAQDLRPLALFDGFQQFLAEPARQLQLVDVRAARADEVRSDQHSQPRLSARIAALEALPPDQVIDDYTPALSLVDRPERAISDLEAWMYEGSRLVPASWDEIAAAAGAESVRAGAGLLTTAAEESGVAEPATLAAVFDAIRRGETAEMVRPLLEGGRTGCGVAQARRAAADPPGCDRAHRRRPGVVPVELGRTVAAGRCRRHSARSCLPRCTRHRRSDLRLRAPGLADRLRCQARLPHGHHDHHGHGGGRCRRAAGRGRSGHQWPMRGILGTGCGLDRIVWTCLSGPGSPGPRRV